MARVNRVFNSLKRAKLLRKRITPAEAGVGIAVVLALVVSTAWVAAQRENFDPGERDLAMETLNAQSVPDTLYKAPLVLWREPGTGVGPATVDLGPLPASLADTPWKPAGRVELFTADTLYEKINGQAEQYMKFGFRTLRVVSLEHSSGATVDVFLYDQADFANCLGLFEEQRGDKPLETVGEVLVTKTALGSYGVAGQIFFQIFGSEPSPDVTAKATEVLDALVSNAGAQPRPRAFRIFAENLGVPVDRIGYTPINVFQFDFANDFWFAQPDSGQDGRLFVHLAASENDATSLFAKIHAEQQEEFEVIAHDGATAIYRHQFLKTFFTLRQDGALVYGMEGHPDQAGADRWTRKLGQELKAEG